MVCAARFGLVLLVLGSSTVAGGAQAPSTPAYSTAGIVNSASNLPNDYAPNTMVSLYGTNLSYNTGGINPGTTTLPTTIGGVTVYFNNSLANIFYVSPTQINVLVPNTLRPGPVNVSVVREGAAGLSAPIVLSETAPELFQSSPGMLLAAHQDGSVITHDAPATKSEVIVIYAVGLGRTTPDLTQGQIAVRAAPIQHLADLQVLLNGNILDAASVLYAGVTPGFAGLYQINIHLPDGLASSPEVRVAIGTQMSVAGLALPFR